MTIPKKYAQDRVTLLILSINLVLLVLCVVSIVLKVTGDTNSVYVVQYRPNLGASRATLPGGTLDILAFPLFSLLIFVSHTILSIRSYAVQRHLANTILFMATILLAMSLIISNLLLVIK